MKFPINPLGLYLFLKYNFTGFELSHFVADHLCLLLKEIVKYVLPSAKPAFGGHLIGQRATPP